MRLFSIVLALFVAFPAFAQDVARQIVVTGEGSVSAAPDMAVLRLGVSREAREASQAMAQTAAAADAVLMRLSEAGVAERDIQTANIGLSPRWQNTNNAPPRIVGYIASNDLSVRIRDLEALGALMDAVVSDGANTMNGLSFSISEPRPLQDQARTMAVQDAKAKGALLAEAAGVSLGAVMHISEGRAASGPMPLARGAMMEASMPIAAGEMDIVVQVTVVFEID